MSRRIKFSVQNSNSVQEFLIDSIKSQSHNNDHMKTTIKKKVKNLNK